MTNCEPTSTNTKTADGRPYHAEVAIRNSKFRSGFRLCLAEAGDAVARLPLAAFLEQGHALKALQDIPFCAQSAGGAQAAML